MPEVIRPPRTRTVETKTTEEIAVDAKESQALGKPWPEWLKDRTPEQMAITEVMIYRREPPSMSGFLEKLGGNSGVPCEAIDENWIANRYGGGVYGVRIYSKDGKSSYEPALRIAGEAKLSPRERSTPAANGDSGATSKLVDALERTIDRLTAAQPAAPASQGARETIELIGALETLRAKVASPPAAPAPAAKSPFEDLNAILALVDRLKPPAPVESQFDKAVKEAMVAQLTQPKKSVIDELKGLAELLPLIQGFGGGDAKDWKTVLIDKGLERIPEVIEGVSKVMGQRVDEAKALAVRDQARANAIAVIRGGAAIPAGPVPVQTSANHVPAAAPAGVPAAPAEPGPWGGPLQVVPIDGAHSAEAPAPPAPVTEEQAAAAIDTYLKNRLVQLVAEGADAGMILDFIDGAAPQMGALLAKSTEAQIRAFLQQDPILAEITKFPNYEVFLEEFFEVLHEVPPEGTRVQ